jgi:hypothetical protein
MHHWWNDINKKQLKNSEINLSDSHVVSANPKRTRLGSKTSLLPIRIFAQNPNRDCRECFNSDPRVSLRINLSVNVELREANTGSNSAIAKQMGGQVPGLLDGTLSRLHASKRVVIHFTLTPRNFQL